MSEMHPLDGPNQPELCGDDQRLLDGLVDAQFDPERMEPLTTAERIRVRRIMALLGLLHDYPADDADETLLHATMARIDRHEEQREGRMKLDSETPRRSFGLSFRLPDFISVAAVLLIGASVLWPLLASVRQQSIDRGCANNMRWLGYAFGHYAADNNGAMPTARAGVMGAGASWDTLSNVVNLAPLLDGQYCGNGHLNCPGNHDNLDSTYSYQWQKPDAKLMWGTGRITVVLGDRNPLIDAARAGFDLPGTTLSADHRGRGQNVLASDGATLWLDRPAVGRDNIWLPHGANQLSRGARPVDLSDVMLAH